MFYPNLAETVELAKNYNIIPITAEYYADTDTPIRIFKQLETEKACFLLESIGVNETTARYSFIGRNPFLTFKSTGDNITITENGTTKNYIGKPMAEFKKTVNRYKSPNLEGIPSFKGGAVGHFSYDIIRQYEQLPDSTEDDLKIPDMYFMFTDEIVAFDHKRQKIVIMVNLHSDGDIEKGYAQAAERIKQIKAEIDVIKSETAEKVKPFVGEVESNVSKEDFCKNVEKAKEYIKNGDIFQVVLSQRFAVKTNADPFDTYRALRLINPSPYMYYLKFDEYQLAGASPEMLVRVENGIVQTGPIAGTRPRGKTPAEDIALEKELIADQKECAEHTMLVDLGRNDIGKVSEFGSVKVTRFMHVERFSHVMHINSDVEGKLRKDKTVFDALGATLPAGTLSGAPKIRAMEIIDELETTKRSTYGGAIGYVSFDGSFDSCITIRTALFKDNCAYIQAGGGIVYDSVPETEYQESVNKAGAVVRAIKESANINNL